MAGSAAPAAIALWERKPMRLIGTSIVATFLLAGTTFADTHTVCPSGCDYTSIQAAIIASADGDVISIHAGTFHEHGIYTLNKAITIQGTLNSDGARVTIIDAQSDGSVFEIANGEDAGTVLKDLVITNGLGTDWVGGGITCKNGSSPTITYCTIEGNSANMFGGGIACFNHSNPIISYCTITNNTCFGGDGAGICCQTSNPTISHCLIEGNGHSHDPNLAQGGGIYCNSCNPTISECSISGNAAGNGGGIYCVAASPTITGCAIAGNTANGEFGGGGIVGAYEASPIIKGCTISFNTPDNVHGHAHPGRGRSGQEYPSFFTFENSMICGTGEHVVGLIEHVGVNHISDCIDVGDLDGDGDVDVDDLDQHHALVGICKSDVNHDGSTDVMDLLEVIGDWHGVCP